MNPPRKKPRKANVIKPKQNPVKQPDDSQAQNSVISRHIMQQRIWSGPLPPAEELEKFAQLLPDAPERIFQQWEKESEHRRNYEAKALEANIKDGKRGRDAAATFIFLAMALAAFALWMGHPWVGTIIGGATIVSVVGAFLKQRSYEPAGRQLQPADEEE